jgi:hypothetical protein
MNSMRLSAAAALVLLPGCALFVRDTSRSAGLMSSMPWSRKDAQASASEGLVLSMARLEASIVSRPANDARIRRLVWEELDESGLMSPDIRGRLNQSGFRIGVAGSATPWVLQSLARDAVRAHRASDEQSLADLSQTESLGPSFGLMAGGKSLLEIQSGLNPAVLPIKQLPELSAIRDRNGLRCVLEVSVKEMNEDRVLLNILPQLHAGAVAPRLSVTSSSEQLPVRQNLYPLYDQQFTLTLMTGEVAVIGRHDSTEWNLGRLFFQPESGTSGSERLLMIRMAGVDHLKGQSDPNFKLTSYDR